MTDGPNRTDDTGEILVTPPPADLAALDRTLPARKGTGTGEREAIPEEPGSKRGLERYKLLEEVGQGGMAIVYRAHDGSLDREVAVKVLHPHLAGQVESRDRLEREAIAVAKLRHENILEIFDYSGRDSDKSFIVTEFIHGTTLRAFMLAQPLPHPEIAEMIVSEIARALEHAHKHGVIHRDVKPENVMIRRDGVVKLTDFGIAQIVDRERMTTTGQLLGSPAYMAPEHVEGGGIDFRTDVFAVGILLYQLAVGELPFRGKNPHEVLKRIAECVYTPPSAANPRIGRRLAAVITRALAKEKDARYADVGELRRELLEDLRDAGIDEPRAELAPLFTSTKPYLEKLGPRLVTALTARGRALRTSGRRAAALELWQRALEITPTSGELLALVAGVERRQRYTRTLLACGLVAAASVVAFYGARAWRSRHPASRVVATVPTTSVTPSREAVSASPAITRAPTPRDDEHAPRPTHRIDRNRNPMLMPNAPAPNTPAPVADPVVVPAPLPTGLRHFELAPSPKAVRVYLDNKLQGAYGPDLQSIELDARPHTLRFENDACYPETVAIAPTEAAGRVVAHLKWKPATLTVQAEPKDAEILLDNSLAPRSGQATPLPMPPMSDGRRSVRVKVSANGFVTEEQEVMLRANEAQQRSFHLHAVGTP